MMGESGWPTVEQLRSHIDRFGCWDRSEADDIMTLTERRR